MVALRLIRSLLAGALVTAASLLLAGPDTICWTRQPMGFEAFTRCMFGPGVDLRWGRPVMHCKPVPQTTGLQICVVEYYPVECNAFDHDDDGDVDLFDLAVPLGGKPPGGLPIGDD